MKERWQRIQSVVGQRAHRLHSAHEYMHLFYFLGVAIEGHGVYCLLAGLLFIYGIVLVALHIEA